MRRKGYIECRWNQMGNGGRRERKNIRGDRKETGQSRLVSTDRGEQSDSEREEEETEINSVRTGFIPPGPQNWAGPQRESEEEERGGEGAALLFISFCSGLKKIYVSACVRTL